MELTAYSPDDTFFVLSMLLTIKEEKKHIENKIISRKKCSYCGKNSRHMCKTCGLSFYCSSNCLKKDHTEHTKVCNKLSNLTKELDIEINDVDSSSISPLLRSVKTFPQVLDSCALCEGNKNLKIFYGTLFCSSCLENQKSFLTPARKNSNPKF